MMLGPGIEGRWVGSEGRGWVRGGMVKEGWVGVKEGWWSWFGCGWVRCGVDRARSMEPWSVLVV